MKLALTSLLSAVAIVVMPGIALAGFAPADRATLQCISPTNCPGASYVTFNSFTNAPNYGDERAFFDAKDASITSPGGFQDKLTVTHGQRIFMRVYVHNNANESAIGQAAATAKNTRIQALLETNKKTSHVASAAITADNANPATVSDTVELTGANPFTMVFDRNAPVNVTYRPNGTGDWVTRPLPGATFANDQTINANVGDWRGCFEFGALITFTAIVSMDVPKIEVPPQIPPTPTPPSAGKPGALPVTGGAGSVLGVFTGVSAAAGAVHYLWGRRFGQ
ncbi:hypothetical protein HYW36_00385 [Candidatus Saccharibacteria bacterium]|nr:hypothetical protein [Candidatus Saccharibacteria bacterium]